MQKTILLFLGICALAGCGGGSQSSQTAKLRVISGGWAVEGELTVIIDGSTVATGIEYPSCVSQVCQALSGYLTVKSGGVDFAVEEAGSTANIVPSEFRRLNLSPDTQNTFVLGGSSEIVGYLFLDDGVSAAGSVKLRIADADPSTLSPMSAWVNSDGSTAGKPEISGVKLGSASSYITLQPGAYTEVFPIECLTGPNCITVGPTSFTANQNVTVYLLNEGFSHRPLILAHN